MCIDWTSHALSNFRNYIRIFIQRECLLILKSSCCTHDMSNKIFNPEISSAWLFLWIFSFHLWNLWLGISFEDWTYIFMCLVFFFWHHMFGFLETVSNKKISIFLLVDWYYHCSDNYCLSHSHMKKFFLWPVTRLPLWLSMEVSY